MNSSPHKQCKHRSNQTKSKDSICNQCLVEKARQDADRSGMVKVDHLQLTSLDSLLFTGNFTTQVDHFDCSTNQLKSLPNEIGALQNLVTLNLAWNQFSELPESIGKLTALCTFSLDFNPQLISLPSSLSKLTRLEELNASDCNLESLPNNLGKCRSLTRINVRYNALTVLPSSLEKLTELTTLNLSGNKLVVPPMNVVYLGIPQILSHLRGLNEPAPSHQRPQTKTNKPAPPPNSSIQSNTAIMSTTRNNIDAQDASHASSQRLTLRQRMTNLAESSSNSHTTQTTQSDHHNPLFDPSSVTNVSTRMLRHERNPSPKLDEELVALSIQNLNNISESTRHTSTTHTSTRFGQFGRGRTVASGMHSSNRTHTSSQQGQSHRYQHPTQSTARTVSVSSREHKKVSSKPSDDVKNILARRLPGVLGIYEAAIEGLDGMIEEPNTAHDIQNETNVPSQQPDTQNATTSDNSPSDLPRDNTREAEVQEFSEKQKKSTPSGFTCPITMDVMSDPVVCAGDGHTYERSAIEKWLKRSNKSPMTGQKLNSKDLIPNHALRSMIMEHQCSNG